MIWAMYVVEDVSLYLQHSNFGILSNLRTSSIFTWVYAGIASAACPSQSGSPAMTSITLCGGHLRRRWALFCKYGVGFLSRLWRSLLEVRHDLCNSEISALIPHFFEMPHVHQCGNQLNLTPQITAGMLMHFLIQTERHRGPRQQTKPDTTCQDSTWLTKRNPTWLQPRVWTEKASRRKMEYSTPWANWAEVTSKTTSVRGMESARWPDCPSS